MLDEPVHLVAHRAEWAEEFASERNRLGEALNHPRDRIVHIGSTAVPGLAAKPTIDIMIGADTLPPPDEWIHTLVKFGYEALGEAGVPGRWYFAVAPNHSGTSMS